MSDHYGIRRLRARRTLPSEHGKRAGTLLHVEGHSVNGYSPNTAVVGASVPVLNHGPASSHADWLAAEMTTLAQPAQNAAALHSMSIDQWTGAMCLNFSSIPTPPIVPIEARVAVHPWAMPTTQAHVDGLSARLALSAMTDDTLHVVGLPRKNHTGPHLLHDCPEALGVAGNTDYEGTPQIRVPSVATNSQATAIVGACAFLLRQESFVHPRTKDCPPLPQTARAAILAAGPTLDIDRADRILMAPASKPWRWGFAELTVGLSTQALCDHGGLLRVAVCWHRRTTSVQSPTNPRLVTVTAHDDPVTVTIEGTQHTLERPGVVTVAAVPGIIDMSVTAGPEPGVVSLAWWLDAPLPTYDGSDIGRLVAAWGSDDVQYDLNGDGIVDGADQGLLLSKWTP